MVGVLRSMKGTPSNMVMSTRALLKALSIALAISLLSAVAPARSHSRSARGGSNKARASSRRSRSEAVDRHGRRSRYQASERSGRWSRSHATYVRVRGRRVRSRWHRVVARASGGGHTAGIHTFMTESWAAENSRGSLLRGSPAGAPTMIAGGEAAGSAGRLASASVSSPSSISQAAGPAVTSGVSSLPGQPEAGGPNSAVPAVDINPFVSAFFDSLAAYGVRAESQGFIVETMDGKVLAEHNADHPFNPASVVKVATSLTAISKLGADYRFRTMLYTDVYLEPGTSTLHGSLYVMGTGDPVFFPENALLIADQLNRHGIRVVDGNLIVEGKFYYAFSASREASAKAFRAAMMPESPNFTQSAPYLQFLAMRAAEQDRSRFVFGDPADPAGSGNSDPAAGTGQPKQGVQAAPTATYVPPSGVPYLKITGETLTQPGINTTNLK